MSNWSEQYLKSQAEFCNSNNLEYCIAPHEHIKNLASNFSSNESTAIESALSILANQKLYELQLEISFLLSECDESPIERQMALALLVCGNALNGGNTTINSFGTPSAEHLIIKPQAKIGVYRVDFLLQYRVVLPKIENGEIIRDVESCKQLIIECDGHDFHEKTKEQAKKDKERDRWMQSLGYDVFRYTGSEIWSDVFKCASESIRVLIDKTSKEAESLSNA